MRRKPASKRVALAFHGHYLRGSGLVKNGACSAAADCKCSNAFTSLTNIEDTIIEPLVRLGVGVDVFLYTTSHSEAVDNLLRWPAH